MSRQPSAWPRLRITFGILVALSLTTPSLPGESAPQEDLLTCRGGPGMTAVIRRISELDPPYPAAWNRNNLVDRTEVLLTFRRAGTPTLEEDSPRRGQCGWLNRPFDEGEPNSVGRMYMPGQQPAFTIACSTSSCQVFASRGDITSARAMELFGTVFSSELTHFEVVRRSVPCNRTIRGVDHFCLAWRPQPDIGGWYDSDLRPDAMATMEERIAGNPLRRLVCRGGGGMEVTLRRTSEFLRDFDGVFPDVGTFLDVRFRRSARAATEVPPRPGECAWADGPITGTNHDFLGYWAVNDNEPSFEFRCTADGCRLGWPEATRRPLFVERARPFITLFDWARNADVLFTLNCFSEYSGLICPSFVGARAAG